MSGPITGDFDLGWIDDWCPSPRGIELKEKREAGKAPGAKRRVNEGSAAKLLKTPGEARGEIEDALQDNKRTQLQRPNEGKTQEEADTVKKPRRGSIVKMHG